MASEEKSHSTGQSRYECTECGERVVSEEHPMVCERCGGDVRNISVPRE